MASVITIIAEIQRVKLEYGVTLLIPTRDGNFVIHFLPRQAVNVQVPVTRDDMEQEGPRMINVRGQRTVQRGNFRMKKAPRVPVTIVSVRN